MYSTRVAALFKPEYADGDGSGVYEDPTVIWQLAPDTFGGTSGQESKARPLGR